MLAVFALARLTDTSQSAVAAVPTLPVSSAVSAGLEDLAMVRTSWWCGRGIANEDIWPG
jgi:hypothetical protein